MSEGEIVTNRYMVVLSAKPATRLKEGEVIHLTFERPDGKKNEIVIKNLIERDEAGTDIPIGLLFRVKQYAESLDDAVKEAASLADGVVSFMTLATGVGIPVVREGLAYDITPNIEDREFIQFFHDLPLKSPSRRELPPKFFLELMNKIIKNPDQKTVERMRRAVRWYRMGVLATDVFDKFNCFWIGLECLNPLLQRSFKVSDDPIHCPNCGHEWVATPTTSGIRKFILTAFSAEKRLYRRMKDLRISVMHGREELIKFISEARELSPLTELALVKAILYLLEIDFPKDLEKNTISNVVPFKAAIEGTLHGSDIDKLGPPNEDPHLELVSHELAESEVAEKGITRTVTTKTICRLGPETRISVHGWRVYGEELTLGDVKVE